MEVIVDTNALIYTIKKKQELSRMMDGQIIIPNLVIEELEKLSKTAKKGADKDAAKLAIQLIKHNKWKIIKLEKGHTDQRIKEYVKSHKCAVFTYDKNLRKL
jgi:rRNA-processing protein FCF1